MTSFICITHMTRRWQSKPERLVNVKGIICCIIFTDKHSVALKNESIFFLLHCQCTLRAIWNNYSATISKVIAKLWVNFCGAAMSSLLSVILKGFYFQLWPEKDLFARFKIGHLFDFFPSEVSKTPSAHKSRQQDSLQAERTCHKRAGTNWSPHTASRWAAVVITYYNVV